MNCSGRGIGAYVEYEAEREGQSPGLPMLVAVELQLLPATDDPLASSIRLALDARRIGLPVDRTIELMEQRGAGIEVAEHALPERVS